MNVRVTFLVCTCALMTVMSAQTVTLRPGRYQATVELEMAGEKMPPETEMQCVTAEDLKDLSKQLAWPGKETMKDCVISDYKATASRITFIASCDDTKWTMDMAYTPDSFTAALTSKDAGKEMMFKTYGKRIGECDK